MLIAILVSVEALVLIDPAAEALTVAQAPVPAFVIFLVGNSGYRTRSSHSIGLKLSSNAGVRELA